MATVIKIKRGNLANMPTLQDGEMALAEDVKELWIGTTGGNYKLTDPGTTFNPNNNMTTAITTSLATNHSGTGTNTVNIQTGETGTSASNSVNIGTTGKTLLTLAGSVLSLQGTANATFGGNYTYLTSNNDIAITSTSNTRISAQGNNYGVYINDSRAAGTFTSIATGHSGTSNNTVNIQTSETGTGTNTVNIGTLNKTTVNFNSSANFNVGAVFNGVTTFAPSIVVPAIYGSTSGTGTVAIGPDVSGASPLIFNVNTGHSGSSSNTVNIMTGETGTGTNTVNIGTSAKTTISMLATSLNATTTSAVGIYSPSVYINTGDSASKSTLIGTTATAANSLALGTISYTSINVGASNISEVASTSISSVAPTVNINASMTTPITLNIGTSHSGVGNNTVNIGTNETGTGTNLTTIGTINKSNLNVELVPGTFYYNNFPVPNIKVTTLAVGAPEFVGQMYLNTSTGKLFIGKDTTTSGWVQIN